MEFPSLNSYLTPPYPPFIVPMPRGIPLTDKDGKPVLPNGATPPAIPYGVPYFTPPGQGPPPPPPANSPAALFGGHPYPLIGNYLPPQYHRFYQDAHFLYFPPDMKLPTKFPPMKFPPDPMSMMQSRIAAEKKVKKKPREPKEEKDSVKKEKPKKRKKTSYCVCERPEDGKFMVGCDVCDNWFHPKCVNISKKVAKTLDYFVCPHCREFVPEEDRQQALEQQQAMQEMAAKKKAKKEAKAMLRSDSPSSDKLDEDGFDYLEQLSKAALQVLDDDKEEKKEQESKDVENEEAISTVQTKRPEVVTFQPIQLIDNARIELSKENIFGLQESQEFLENIISSATWQQEQVQMYGTTYQEPRLSAWYGDADCNYTINGIVRPPNPWTEQLLKIKTRVEEICRCTFNNALVNYYRSGEDYMGFHDEQQVLGSKDKIAYVSLGSDRNFIIKHRNTDEVHFVKVFNGSLLVMYGEHTAKNYISSVPKSRSSTGPRVNLILRNVEKTTPTTPHIQPVESEGTTV